MHQFVVAQAGIIADTVLAVHAAIVAFVGGGEAAILLGGLLGTRWVRNLRLRAVHMCLMVFIAAETALGLTCPLTSLEQMLRINAGEAAYSGSFIVHWLSPFIYFDAPPWVFVMLHGLAAIVVVGTWFWVPPDRPARVGVRVADVA